MLYILVQHNTPLVEHPNVSIKTVKPIQRYDPIYTKRRDLKFSSGVSHHKCASNSVHSNAKATATFSILL